MSDPHAFLASTASAPFQADVTVIGAGPVGLFSVFACGMLGLSTVVVEALPMIGGQCTALYPEKPIYDIPACPFITAEELIRNLEMQIKPFKPQILLNSKAQTLTRTNDGFILTTDNQKTLHSKAMLIAAGAGAFGPNRIPFENAPLFEENGTVRYAVRSKQELAGKKIVIAGGGDSAVDWALSLIGIAAEITLVHRRDKFRASPDSSAKLNEAFAAGKIKKAVPCQLHGLHGENGRLEKISVISPDNRIEQIAADILLPLFGLATDLGPIAEWGIGFTHQHLSVNPATCATDLPGVFAIGDVASYPGKLKLILQGFSEASFAAKAIQALIFPETAHKFEHSTASGIPTCS